jgi:hypothetical protein
MQASETPALRPGVAVALRLSARASCPRSRNAGGTPALPGEASRGRDAHAPFKFMGARASGAHASERAARAPSGCSSRIAPGCARIVSSEPQRGQDARAPFEFMGARLRRACERGYASSAQAGRDARASSGCSGRIAPGCARLRRACKRGCTSGAHVNRDTTAQPASLRRVNL